MLVVSKKSCIEADYCEALKVPYSLELREFFTLSRKYQTLYCVNSEWQLNTRTFQFHEGNVIEEFITQTMFSKKCTEGTIALDEEEKRVIKNITERMIKESRKYNSKVHFSVIWVYNFIYSNKEMESLPVFKIYKMKGGLIFLDAFSKVYQTWGNFIDNAELGESLLCVPRNGEYSNDEGVLNLEYVLSKKTRRAAKASLWLRFVAPLSQVHCSWLEKVQSWLVKHPKVREVVDNILSFLKDNSPTIFAIALAVFASYFELGSGLLPVFLCKEAIKIASQYADLTRTRKGFQESLSKCEKALNTYSRVRPQLDILFTLMRKERTDRLEILKTLLRLVETSKAGDGLPRTGQNSLGSHIGMSKQS